MESSPRLSPPLFRRGMEILGSKPASMAIPSTTMSPLTTSVIHGPRSAMVEVATSDEVSAPMVPKNATNPAVRVRPTSSPRSTLRPRFRGLLPAADPQEVGQVGREHGEPARVDRGHQPGPERHRQINVEHLPPAY